MRAILWFLALFGAAAAAALFAGNNHNTVTLFWAPYRIDVSFNLAVLLLSLGFIVMHLALRALSGLFSIPGQAKRWRLQQKERAIQSAILDALAHLLAGRFLRARKAAELTLGLEKVVADMGESLPYAARLRALAHLLAAESAYAVQDKAVREAHLQQAIAQSAQRSAQGVREGVQLRAARWAFGDRDAGAALQWLDQLPQGASRRIAALRLRFKAARLGGHMGEALDTARLLTKHHAFTPTAGASIARGLAVELLRSGYDPLQIQQSWDTLEPAEQRIPEVALEAAERLLAVQGAPSLALQWIFPVWEAWVQQPETLQALHKLRLVRVLERSFSLPSDTSDTTWLARIEVAQKNTPRDPYLQYLSGIVCKRMQLWGKAQQWLTNVLPLLQDPALKRDAWRALAEMAEHRQDAGAAAHAYKQAVLAAVADPVQDSVKK